MDTDKQETKTEAREWELAVVWGDPLMTKPMESTVWARLQSSFHVIKCQRGTT